MDLLTTAAEALEAFEHALRASIRYEHPRLKKLFDCMAYSLFSGGKRLRPMLCFAAGSLFELPPERLMSSACAVEMIHTASLILDDLPYMDDARLRRGKPTNHMVYGQDLAVLASVGLLNGAYELVLGDARLPRGTRAEVVATLAKTVGVGGMVGGQFVDLAACHDGKPGIEVTLEYIYSKKTSSLFEASAEVAAIVAGADDDEVDALRDFARGLGLAFQALDDITDAAPDKAVVNHSGKADKFNIVDLIGEDESRLLLSRNWDRALAAARRFGERGKVLEGLARAALGPALPRVIPRTVNGADPAVVRSEGPRNRTAAGPPAGELRRGQAHQERCDGDEIDELGGPPRCHAADGPQPCHPR